MTDRALIDMLSRRLAVCSEVLGRLATKDGPTGEAARCRIALEKIAELPFDLASMDVARSIAREALK